MVRRDHPRIRGEHTHAAAIEATRPGSSPHTRGARLPGAGVGRERGIIPAYAGSTSSRSSASSPASDHPRIRGEHFLPTFRRILPAGSSPHTRGALFSAFADAGSPGIIPAYAGSTIMRSFLPGGAADHPRIRGEHGLWRDGRRRHRGSSPHTRGAHPPPSTRYPSWRIIPAYAGSTIRAVAPGTVGQDHPRIRGEHVLLQGDRGAGGGSSPHTRGARFRPSRAHRSVRIIPAYAGSTISDTTRRAISRDHPRIRGEHLNSGAAHRVAQGSSPHTRGARRRPSWRRRRTGIIPAYAGSTEIQEGLVGVLGDHPRIRGEHVPASLVSSFGNGSSPHTRGALRRPQGRDRGRRIIPAYAGSTSAVSCR